MPRGNLSSRSPMRCAPALSPPPNVFDPAGTARAPFHTGEPTLSVHPTPGGRGSPPLRWASASHRRRHQPLSHAASRRDSSPFRGAERWAEVCGVCASVCRDADTVVFLPPVRGGVPDAPRSRDCRAALDAPVRPDQPHPRFPRRATIASTSPRIQSRGHSPRTISCGRTDVVHRPRPGERGSPPLRRIG